MCVIGSKYVYDREWIVCDRECIVCERGVGQVDSIPAKPPRSVKRQLLYMFAREKQIGL